MLVLKISHLVKEIQIEEEVKVKLIYGTREEIINLTSGFYSISVVLKNKAPEIRILKQEAVIVLNGYKKSVGTTKNTRTVVKKPNFSKFNTKAKAIDEKIEEIVW